MKNVFDIENFDLALMGTFVFKGYDEDIASLEKDIIDDGVCDKKDITIDKLLGTNLSTLHVKASSDFLNAEKINIPVVI